MSGKDYEVYLDDLLPVNRPFTINNRKAIINTTTTSFSHILGNLTAIIEKYIEDMLPVGYFKEKYVTTEEAYKNLKDFRKNKIDFERPYLIIDPKILMNEESEALPWIHWDKFKPTDYTDFPNLYMINHEFFLNDKEKGFYLGYTVNRYKFEFDITIIVDTPMQRISLENYLKSNMRFRHMYTISRYTETIIPKEYIEFIARKYDLDINSNELLAELNKRSKWSILRLHRPATGKTEFFVLNMSTLQLRMPNYPVGDRVKTGRIDRYSQVKFTIELETNVMNNFIMLTDEEIHSSQPMSEYMARVSLTNRMPDIDPIIGNKSAYTKITMEFDNSSEEIELLKFISDDVKPVLKYIKDHNLNNDYVALKIYKFSEEIDVNDPNLVEFDKNNYILKMKNVDLNSVYNVIIYFDMDYLAKVKTQVNPVNMTVEDFKK